MRPISFAAMLLATVVATPLLATTLFADSGWQNDRVNSLDQPSDNSPWTFTLGGNGTFSVTDDFVVGDVYTLSGSISGTTTFYAGAGTDVQATGSYGPAWTNASYSKIAVLLGPGSYSISIAGNCGGGCPAGFGVRLDTAAVPEPAVWGLMIAGFGMVGTAMRRRTAAVAA